MFRQHRGNFLYFLSSKFFFLQAPPPLLSFHSELSIQSGVIPGKPCKFYKEKCIHCALQKKIGPIHTRNPPPFKLSKHNIDSGGGSASFTTAVCSRYAKRSLPHKKTSRMTLSFNSAFIPFRIWRENPKTSNV